MKELKITPISIDAATTVAGIGKNISDVVAFQIALAKDINRAITEFNDLLPLISEPYDDSLIKEKLEEIITTMPKEVDNSEILGRLGDLEGADPVAYDDHKLKKDHEDMKLNISELNDELKILKDASLSVKIEIDSNRKESGLKIDILEQKVNKITGVK